ncbi:amidase [Agrobacterium vitis]|uniref:Indoleacetamide hydrolase n=1 Tax=Agrobacterium vitis TaxID=373 RepID=A0ABD6GEK7_AGRVI|nr:amidase [Agrobacterium vitis]MUO81633.1 amidase [Agrobacterium vitis]MUO95223.1 amidase [Agrobacterium vitis]MUP07341.1 amidase [Agrobacterium vitis]MUZ83677.1 amidase [Agrobacterium vitis]MVA09277.1 amidase [Agrobacterium vitis]
MTPIMSGKSIAQLAVLIQSGALDPQDLAHQTLAAIRDHADQTIFTRLTPERAMQEAKASASRIRAGCSLGPLDGIPIAWKDLFDLKGITTTAGSVVLDDQPPAVRDADVVQALANAGMVSIGHVNMSEFAFSGLGVNPHYGTPRNPHSMGEARVPGGSSSGSAVAVAAGLVPVSIGTDTGGSVRIPSAFNGIVGYKATRGRYSMRGVFPLSKSLDSLGPLCRTVQDAVWVDAAMRGLTQPQVTRTALAGRRFVVPERVFFDGAEDGVVQAFEAAIRRLEQAGAVVRRQAFPIMQQILDVLAKHGPLVTAEAYVLHRHRLHGPDAARMDQRVATRARLGENISLASYVELIERREQLIAEFTGQIGTDEFILTPTVAHVAPLTAPLVADDDLFVATNGKTLRNTMLGNFLDWCAVSLPCGTGDANMPVGLQVSGPAGSDEALLGLALSVEAVVCG